MLTALYNGFLQACALGLVAFLLGRYVGHGPSFPSSRWKTSLIFLQVWLVAYAAQLLLGTLGYALGAGEKYQSIFEFLLPLITGAYFARQLLHWHARPKPVQ